MITDVSATDRVDVSVVIVSYRVRDLLLRCLGTLADAGGDLTCEVVVVDNDSRDGSVDAVRERFPEVVLEEGDRLEIVHFVGGG